MIMLKLLQLSKRKKIFWIINDFDLILNFLFKQYKSIVGICQLTSQTILNQNLSVK